MKCKNKREKSDCRLSCRCEMTDIEAALDSLHCAIVFDSRDWAGDRRLTWIYGVLIGWDAKSWKELAEEFGFSEEAITRARRYHKALMAAKRLKTKAK